MVNNRRQIDKLIKFIRKNYLPEEKIKTGKDGQETIFFRKSSKALCYIESQNNVSKVVVVIGCSLADKVKESNISEKTKKIFEKAKQYYDGKWLVFDANSPEEIEDIKTLLLIKRKPIIG